MKKIPGDSGLGRNYILLILFFMLFTGCIAPDNEAAKSSDISEVNSSSAQSDTPHVSPASSPAAMSTVKPEDGIQQPEVHTSAYENMSVAVEVNYREYVDWFMAHNLNIRAYTPQEYVCGQYTVDMINDSAKAGYKAYFAAITFSDGTGHALVSFKSTVFNYTSWYFFEPQTNKLMTPETLKQVLGDTLGKTVTEVNIYGYFDDAGDKDPASWRFAYLLYNKKY